MLYISPMHNPTKSIGYHLRVACQSRQRAMNRSLKTHGITHAQYMVMQYLARAEENDVLKSLSQNKLALALWLDPMMISNILTLLEKKKYILRKKSNLWVQALTLSLTKTGATLVEKAVKAVEEIEDTLFDTKDPKKLKKALKAIVEQA